MANTVHYLLSPLLERVKTVADEAHREHKSPATVITTAFQDSEEVRNLVKAISLAV